MSPRIVCLLVMITVANAYNYGRPTFLFSMANAVPSNVPVNPQQNVASSRQSTGSNQMYMGNSMPNYIQRSAHPMYMRNPMFMPSYMQRGMPTYVKMMPNSMYVGYPNYMPSFMPMRMPMNRRSSRQRGADVDRPDGVFDLDYPMGMRGGQGWGWGGPMGGQTPGFMMRYNQLENMDLI